MQMRKRKQSDPDKLLYIFSGLRFIDIEEFHNRTDSMELKSAQQTFIRHIEAAKERLLKKWVFIE